MKTVVFYMFSVLMCCAYLATNMGFGVHTCSADGSMQVKLLAGEVVCTHAHQDGEHDHDHDFIHEHKECGCDEHDGSCCHTLVYILDKAQNVAHQVKIDVPKIVLDFTSGVESKDVPVICHNNLFAFEERGPGGGLAPLRTPLRL